MLSRNAETPRHPMEYARVLSCDIGEKGLAVEGIAFAEDPLGNGIDSGSGAT